ncbi:ABC transporter substrate-binding protein [Egicoccus sp. AB-alg6-2]|uniref:ABC transporter substrate-binding protein n=1 Tax=Egicoccus sp. AB-alg6-2 TaxID=3242692 RepID=UPI00359E9938
MRRRVRLLSHLATASLLTACASAPTTEQGAGARTAPGSGPAATSYPLEVANCGHTVVFHAAPERVVLLNSAPTSALQAIGVLERTVARAGAFPPAYFDEATRSTLEAIPSLGGDDIDAAGHFQISQEVVLAHEPDLVLGLPDGISRDALTDADIPVLEEPAMCPEGLPDPGFDDIYAQVALYGEVFDQQDAAAEAIERLRARVATLTTQAAGGRTAAVLFPTVGAGAGYAYGTRSMTHPQLEAAGFTNAFADVDERVFEVTLEEVLDRDPDVLVLLHVDGDPERVEAEIRGLPGADGLTAVANDDILVQLFNFSEPPTPLSIDGLERITATFGDGS